MSNYDAIVLGTGGVGSAAAYHLARRGAKVLGIDQFPGGHDRGSSHGETRVIRQAYFEHADYVPLLLRAYELWRLLETETGADLLHQVGLLQVGPPDGIVVRGVLQAAHLHNLPVESLTGEEVEIDGTANLRPGNLNWSGLGRVSATHLLASHRILPPSAVKLTL